MTVRQDLRIRQGETWSYAFTLPNADAYTGDLSAYTARVSIREGYGRSLEACLSTTVGQDQGDIVITAEGAVTLSMSADNTTDLLDNVYQLLMIDDRSEHFQRRVTQIYDLELISPDGIVTRVLQGVVIIERGARYG